jgi:hypothetical protein
VTGNSGIVALEFPCRWECAAPRRFGLKDVDTAIKSVGGQGVPDVIHASLMPWL